MAFQASSDASFYSLVHHMQVTDAQQATANPVQQRIDQRYQVNSVQYIAPYVDGKLPKRTDFSRIVTNDLSANGFSYLAEKTPHHDYLVVALGKAPHVFLAAQIVHTGRTQAELRDRHRIGCRFIGKLRDLSLGEFHDAGSEEAC